jgi:hypothetical protein
MTDNLRALLTTYIIKREYASTHNIENISTVEHPELKEENFTIEDLRLSLDDFSRKQGWMG